MLFRIRYHSLLSLILWVRARKWLHWHSIVVPEHERERGKSEFISLLLSADKGRRERERRKEKKGLMATYISLYVEGNEFKRRMMPWNDPTKRGEMRKCISSVVFSLLYRGRESCTTIMCFFHCH